jgi:hypothetical protein
MKTPINTKLQLLTCGSWTKPVAHYSCSSCFPSCLTPHGLKMNVLLLYNSWCNLAHSTRMACHQIQTVLEEGKMNSPANIGQKNSSIIIFSYITDTYQFLSHFWDDKCSLRLMRSKDCTEVTQSKFTFNINSQHQTTFTSFTDETCQHRDGHYLDYMHSLHALCPPRKQQHIFGMILYFSILLYWCIFYSLFLFRL